MSNFGSSVQILKSRDCGIVCVGKKVLKRHVSYLRKIGSMFFFGGLILSAQLDINLNPRLVLITKHMERF